eukprot:NODE_300_length_10433_cov_0.716470.p7 type:complete len:205 gc:universal NODE_300_length_10433_cov_0.716470:9546-10160(+)
MRIEIQGHESAKKVAIKGEWDNWTNENELARSENGFSIDLDIPSGNYEFKFIIDGDWQIVDDYEKSTSQGYENNILVVKNESAAKVKEETLANSLPQSSTEITNEKEDSKQSALNLKESQNSVEQASKKPAPNSKESPREIRGESVEQLIDQFDAIKVNPPVLEKKDSRINEVEKPYFEEKRKEEKHDKFGKSLKKRFSKFLGK